MVARTKLRDYTERIDTYFSIIDTRNASEINPFRRRFIGCVIHTNIEEVHHRRRIELTWDGYI